MKAKRVWLDIVVIGVTASLAFALILVILGAAAGAAGQEDTSPASQASSNTQVFDGVVTCSKCGAKHSARMGQSPARCTRVCVRSGAKFALVNGNSTYVLDGDLMLLKHFAGERVKVTGTLDGTTIHVVSAKEES